MDVAVVQIGNSKGIRLSKTLIEKYNIKDLDLLTAETENQSEENTQADQEEIEEVASANVKKLAKVNIQHYKGLGEMNPSQLWETTMDPQTRLMKVVTIQEAAKADETFEILMGAEVAPRKKFIQTRAKSVQNLDI